MRKISANYIFPITSKPLKNGILVTDDEGKILELIDTKGDLTEIAGLEHYNGVLVPGFVNTHCHLELSHLKNAFEKHTKLENFIGRISEIRTADKATILAKAKQADTEMKSEGIVAVGDISNQTDSIEVKKQSSIRYYSFVETLGMDINYAYEAFDKALAIVNELEANKLPASIVPHAPYSISEKLFRLITERAYETNSILSMHNQESEAENQLFINKTGKLFDKLEEIGVALTHFYPTGFNSLPSTLHQLPKCNKTILVHNTFSSEKDIDWASKYSSYLYWAFCPNSNLYIENKLPDFDLFVRKNQKMTIGTDSLASNTRLSILEEMKTIQNHSSVSFSDILKWATLNGAEALDMHIELGSFEIDKTPGINLIENFDFQNMKLSTESSVKVLL